MTKQEKHLWHDFLRELPIKFQRQKAIGNYIVDFYCYKAKLVIEIDGSQHFEDAVLKYDNKRTEFLQSLGLNVIRFTNIDIDRNFDQVCENVWNILPPPTSWAPPSKREAFD